MKVSKDAIRQFKEVCLNEQDISDEIARYKILRDFEIGVYIQALHEEIFEVGFGTLRFLCNKGVITNVYRGVESYRVSQYKKYRYDYEHGMVR